MNSSTHTYRPLENPTPPEPAGVPIGAYLRFDLPSFNGSQGRSCLIARGAGPMRGKPSRRRAVSVMPPRRAILVGRERGDADETGKQLGPGHIYALGRTHCRQGAPSVEQCHRDPTDTGGRRSDKDNWDSLNPWDEVTDYPKAPRVARAAIARSFPPARVRSAGSPGRRPMPLC